MTESKRPKILSLLGIALVTIAGWGCGQEVTPKVGVVLPLTGPLAVYGEPIRRGIDIALAQAAADGGLPGLQLDVVDSEGDPQRAAAALDELYAGGAVAAIGGVTSAEALQMVGVADARDRVLLSPTASSPDLTGISRNFFRVFPSDFQEGTQMARFAAERLGLKTVAILAEESPYGRGVQGVFKSELERHGGSIVAFEEFPARVSDFSGLVERVATLGPDGVYIAAYWDDIVSILHGLHAARYPGAVLTTSAFATPRAVREAGEGAEGVLFTRTVFELNDPAAPVRHLVEAYRAAHGEDPDLYAAHGYDAMLVLQEALREGTGAASDLWKGVRGIRALRGASGILQFDEKGDVQKYPRVYVLLEGAPVEYDKHVEEQVDILRQRLEDLEHQQEELRRRATEKG